MQESVYTIHKAFPEPLSKPLHHSHSLLHIIILCKHPAFEGFFNNQNMLKQHGAKCKLLSSCGIQNCTELESHKDGHCYAAWYDVSELETAICSSLQYAAF